MSNQNNNQNEGTNKQNSTVQQVENNLKKPVKPKFGMEEIRKTLPKIAGFHSDLSELELNLPKGEESNDLSLAISKLASAVTLLTTFHNQRR